MPGRALPVLSVSSRKKVGRRGAALPRVGELERAIGSLLQVVEMAFLEAARVERVWAASKSTVKENGHDI